MQNAKPSRRPLFIARQAAFPTGLLGKLIAAIMDRETVAINRQAIATLQVQTGDDVLDIGCGSGASLAMLQPLVGAGSVSGIDPSPVMVERARRKFSQLDPARRPLVATARVEQLPFVDATFSAVMSVHTAYFWADLDAALAEIARVMRPGGRLMLVLRTADNRAVPSFPREVYRFHSQTVIRSALGAAGLVPQDFEPDGGDGAPARILARK
jgi:ubiquinone/menaquinone biosynthesis C-methylase UbiE